HRPNHTTAQGWGWSHGGEPPARLRGRALPDARLLDAGKAPRRNTEGGNQPADKSLIDRRLKRSISCPVQLISERAPAPPGRIAAAKNVDYGHKSLAACRSYASAR